MQRLPVELHSKIFTKCLRDGPYVTPENNEAPLVLLQVCRKWRRLALQTPDLWRSLNGTHDYIPGGNVEPVTLEEAQLYQTWLSRSANRSLSLAISFSEADPPTDVWMDLIRGHGERFERLRIVDGAWIDLNLLLDNVPFLKYLTVVACYDGDRALTISNRLPSLRTLTLDQVNVSPSTLTQDAWANLTRLAVRLPEGVTYEASELLHLLESCDQLESLLFGPVSLTHLPQSSGAHSKLRTLSIVVDEFRRLEDVVAFVSLPSLNSLRLLPDFDAEPEEALASDEDVLRTVLGDLDSGSNGQEAASEGVLANRACKMLVQCNDEFFAMLDLGWHGLTHINVEVYGLTGILGTILTRCPNLQALTFRGKHCSPGSTSLPGPLTHCALSHLTIFISGEIGDLLSEATLPGLQELVIIAESYGEPEEVRSFLKRSNCPLSFLELRAKSSRVWSYEDRVELEALAPTLVELYV